MRFDRFEIDSRQRVLLRDGKIVRLTPKAFDLLELLVSRANEVVPKSELVERLWPDTVVSDASLSKLVFIVRKELGGYIETIPKRGYRFIGVRQALSLSDQAPQAPRQAESLSYTMLIGGVTALLIIATASAGFLWRSRTATRPERTYLAVMPFTAITRGDEPLARGISEFVTARLSTIRGVSVMPSMIAVEGAVDSRKVARQLGTGFILDGTVQRTGDRIGIACQLVSVDDKLPIRTSFVLASPDIFELEERVAGKVANLLELTESMGRSADKALTTPERQQAYVRAVGLLSAKELRDIDEAIAILERLSAPGVPRSPLVLAALGRAHLLRFHLNEGPHELEAAERYAVQASALEGGRAHVHALRGAIARERGDSKTAVSELQTALALEPDANDVLLELASAYKAAGMLPKAQETYEHVIEIHPMCALCFHSFGQFYSTTGRLDDAAAMHRKAIALDPDSAKFQSDLAVVLMLGGSFHEAASLLDKALAITRNNEALSNLGYCEYLDGDFESAAKHFAEARDRVPNDYLAWGNLGDALRALPDRRRDADEAFGKALALAREEVRANPNAMRIRANLAEYLAKHGDAAAADRELAAALATGSSQPDYPDILFSAAAVNAANGRKTEAVGFLQRAAKAGMSPALFTADPQFSALRSEPAFRAMRGTPRAHTPAASDAPHPPPAADATAARS